MPSGWPYEGGWGKGKGPGKGLPRRQVGGVVDSYLQPLLLHSVQNTLSDRSNELLRKLWQTADIHMPMRFYVSAKLNETNVIVCSTDAASCAVGGQCDEPTVGVAIARKTTVFSNNINGCSVIFSMAGESLGQVSSGFSTVRICEDSAAIWLYANPIMEVSDNQSPADQVIGILGVEGNDDRAYDVFTNNVFQKEVEAISCEVGPYLSLLSSLKQVSKR